MCDTSPMPENPTKRCRDCKALRSVYDFYRNKMSKDGRQSYCKECSKARTAAYRKANPAKIREYGRRAYQKRVFERNTSWI